MKRAFLLWAEYFSDPRGRHARFGRDPELPRWGSIAVGLAGMVVSIPLYAQLGEPRAVFHG
jgi:hypothetical protein